MHPTERWAESTAAPTALWVLERAGLKRVTWVAAILSLGHSTDRPKVMEPGCLLHRSPLVINHERFDLGAVINLRAANDSVHNSGF